VITLLVGVLLTIVAYLLTRELTEDRDLALLVGAAVILVLLVAYAPRDWRSWGPRR
jgi:uncharacterized membrane protein (UPF0136 family)